MMRSAFLAITLFLFASLAFAGAEGEKPRETSEAPSDGYVGLPVPAFKAVTASGENISSTEHGARALIIDLWALTCASCLDEMKALEPVYRDLSEKGLRIWAVNTEDIGGKEIEKGLRKMGIEVSYDLIPDPGLEITKLFTNWFIPVTVIVDSEGIVQYYKIGFKEADVEKIKAKLGVLLAQ